MISEDPFDVLQIWQGAWPELRDQIDSLVLVAFRVLVCWLERREFFLHPPRVIDEARRSAYPPAELTTLLRTRDSKYAHAFVRLVDDRLGAHDASSVAALAFAIDTALGPELSGDLGSGNRDHVCHAAQAVNAANRVLMRKLGPERPLILVRLPQQFWSRYEKVVSQFPQEPQDIPSNFMHLLPIATHLRDVHYSALGGNDARKLIVALWPVPAPSITSPALMTAGNKNSITFRFKSWGDLPPDIRQQHLEFADQIAKYIGSAEDSVGTVHIVAAPELMLAPQSHDRIKTSVADLRNASWIVFPGSYHIERGKEVVNRATIHIGGVLDRADLMIDPVCGAISAVKRTPFVVEYNGVRYIEEIDRSVSSIHLLDTSIGRIAVMICRDFLEVPLRNEVVSMGIDHLLVLSMSPDSGFKFKTAMDDVSNFRVGSFFVNAYTTGQSHHAAYRKPLQNEQVMWKDADAPGQPWVFVLKN